MNIFKAIGSFFKMIFKVVIMVFQLFILVFEIIVKISCPISIFTNIHTCSYFWLLDIIFFIIWLIVYIICFIFIFVPIFIGCILMCICIGAWMGECWFVSPDDVCPDKKVFLNFIENIYQVVFGSKLLYRDEGDIDMCYCVSSLERLFDPLTQFRNYLGGVANDSKSNTRYLIIPFIILIIIYINNSKNSPSE
jgi:hypothetical protein